GKTPHSALVVELVEPDDASPGPTLTDRSADAFIRAADSTALPHADVGIRAPADTNRVLQLDGKSYLELPPNIFKELTEATIEAWIKWDRLVPGADLFDFGIYNSEMWISPGGGGPVQSTTSDLTAHISYCPRQRGRIQPR